MNRRDFIKRSFGSVLALALPNVPIPKDEGGFLVPEGLVEPILRKGESYYLGKGTLSFTNNGSTFTFPCIDFEIHRTPLESKRREISTPIQFTLDEINEDNIKMLMEGDNDIG